MFPARDRGSSQRKLQPIASLQERSQKGHTDCREPLRASDVPTKPELSMDSHLNIPDLVVARPHTAEAWDRSQLVW